MTNPWPGLFARRTYLVSDTLLQLSWNIWGQSENSSLPGRRMRQCDPELTLFTEGFR